MLRLLILILLLASTSPLYASDCNLNGIWNGRFDFSQNISIDGRQVNHRIKFYQQNGQIFGTYLDQHHDHTFTVSCFHNTSTILNLVYRDHRNPYRSITVLKSAKGGYVGTWYDNSGNSGDVVFTQP